MKKIIIRIFDKENEYYHSFESKKENLKEQIEREASSKIQRMRWSGAKYKIEAIFNIKWQTVLYNNTVHPQDTKYFETKEDARNYMLKHNHSNQDYIERVLLN